jgi:hypothetical protein
MIRSRIQRGFEWKGKRGCISNESAWHGTASSDAGRVSATVGIETVSRRMDGADTQRSRDSSNVAEVARSIEVVAKPSGEFQRRLVGQWNGPRYWRDSPATNRSDSFLDAIPMTREKK